MMPYIIWKDFYSVGDPVLDAQHMQIIGLLNEIFDAMQQNKSRKVIKPILDRLVQYTFEHFESEEATFLESDYPASVEHKALHDKIRHKTMDLQENADLVTLHNLLGFLKEWWLGHIQGVDKQYKPYLKLTGSPR